MEYLIIVGLLLASGFFSGGELALMTLNPIRVETAAREGKRVAKLQLAIRRAPQRFLSTILVGNNLVNISMAALATVLAMRVLAPDYGERSAVLIATLVITLLTVLFAELLPKTLAAVQGERMAAIVTIPLYGLSRVLTPVSIVLEAIVNPLVRLFSGGRPPESYAPGREEMLTALRLSQAGGHLHHMDVQVAQEALQFSTIDLRDVMTPRVDVTGVPEGATLGEALLLMNETGYSRLPVFRGSLDEILGVVLIKDMVGMLAAEAREGTPRDWFHDSVLDHLREVSYFPETKSIVDALAEIRVLHNHMVVVVDEHGGTAGIVTLEDILEELIGEIRDESDPQHASDIVTKGPGFAIVSGRARLDDLPLIGDAPLPDFQSDAASIGGLIMERLGRTAVVGDVIVIESIRIRVLQVVRNSIKLVRLEVIQPTEAASESSQ